MILLRGSGGGESETPDPPTEAPNTARAKQIARISDIVSCGVIGGLVDGLKSIYYDNTPVQNEDDTLNFEGVEYWQRTGTDDQEPVPGMSAAENEISLGVEVKHDEPITRRLSNIDIDAVRVSLRWSSLVERDEDGNVNGTSMSVLIEVRPSDGDWYDAVSDVFADKTVTPYERMYRIDLPGTGPWDVRVTKRTKDGNGSSKNNTTFWARYTEIIDEKFTYPGVAYIAQKVDQQQFGSSIPVRSFDIDGRLVRLPDNYDPETGVYAGLWSGEFKVGVSSNPAWVLFDLLTGKNGALGIPDSYVDKWAFYDAARWCDDLVPDGRGGTRRRYTFNGVLQSQEDAYPVLMQVAGTFRGILYWASSIVTVMVDRPRAPSRLVTSANVVNGIFRYSTAGQNTLKSVIQVVWNDPDDLWKATPDVVEDPVMISDIGLRVHRLAVLGCSVRAEAISAGAWYLEKQKAASRSIGYVAGWDHVDAMPGEVISVVDPLSGDIRSAGRLSGCSTQYCLFDAPVTFEAAEGHRLAFSCEVARAEGSDISASATRSALVSTTTDFLAAGFAAGHVVQLSGLGNKRGPGQCVVRAVEQHLLVVSAPLLDAPAGSTVTVVARAVIEREIQVVETIEEQISVDSILTTYEGEPLYWIERLEGTQITFVSDGVLYTSRPVTWEYDGGPITTRIVKFTEPLSAPLPLGAVWMLTSFQTTEWQIISKTEVDRHQFEIAAVSYDPTMWDRIDNGLMIDDVGPVSPYPTGLLPSPLSLTATEYLYRQGLGIQSAALVSWSSPGDSRIAYYEAQVQRPGGPGWQGLGVVSGMSIDVREIVPGEYGFRVRAIDHIGARSSWAEIAVYLEGMTKPPAAPSTFRSSVNGDQILLTWTPPLDLDLAAYELRWSPDVSAAWGAASVVVSRIPGLSTSLQVSGRNGRYLLKSIDFSGSYSIDAVSAVVETADQSAVNVVESIDEGPSFAGDRDGLAVLGGVLSLQSSWTMADWTPLSIATPLAGTSVRTEGTYEFDQEIDLGDSYLCKITPVASFGVVNRRATIASWTPLSIARPLSGASGDDVEIMFQVKIDGGEWQTITAGDHRGQLFRFRIVVKSRNENITPEITQLSVTVDMPDRIISGGDVICPVGGVTIDFLPAFYSARPLVIVDSQDMQTGDYRSVTGISNEGFTVQFFNAANTSVERSFDWVARGYGSLAA